jgi:hypothetical protein
VFVAHYDVQFALPPDPSTWGADLQVNHPEPDDYLHNPDAKGERSTLFAGRGLLNVGCLFLLAAGLVTLLYVPKNKYLGSLTKSLAVLDTPL